MPLGVGQFLLGSLMPGLLGNKEEEQQPTQVASNTQPQQQGGVFNALTNVSNSMFSGMSQEQVYRMGQGFNTLRFEPSDKMHDSFETRIQTIRTNKAATEKQNTTVQYLKGKKFDGLADLVSLGLLNPSDAITKSLEEKDIPEWEGQLGYVMAMMANLPEGAEIPWYLHGILNIPEKPEKNEIEVRLELLANPPKDAVTGEPRDWTDLELEVGFKIQPDDIPLFRAELQEIDTLAALDPEKYTPEVILEMKMDRFRDTFSKTELPNSAQEYKFYTDSLTLGEVPISYLAFKQGAGGGDATSIEEYEYYETQAKARNEIPISYFDWKNQSTDSGAKATSIEEYNFYLDNVPAGETPMTYEVFTGKGQTTATSPATSIEEYEYYKNNTKDDPPMTYDVFTNKGQTTTAALPNAVQEYEYYKTNTKDDPPMDFISYKAAVKGGGIDIDVNMPDLNLQSYGNLQTSNLVKKHNTQVDGIDGLLFDIRELHKIQAILDEAVDGKIKFGILEPLYTKASQVASSLGLTDGNQATKAQVMQSAFGGETFKMLKILGLGTKGIDTVPERIFLQESFVGTPQMTVEQLILMTQQRIDVLVEGVNEYNKRVNVRTEDGLNSAYFKLYEQTFSVKLQPVEVPLRKGQKKIQVDSVVSKYF